MIQDEAFGIIPIRQAPDGSYQFLLIQHNAGHWGFPKGHAEPDESPVDSACREFTEETGIATLTVIAGTSFVEQYQFQQRGRAISKTVVYFLAWVAEAEVRCQASEIKDYRWVSFDDAMTLMSFTAGRTVLREAQAYLLEQAAVT